jgi:AraC-like DNA-binding protein
LSAQVNEKDLRKMSYDEIYDLYFDYNDNLDIQKEIARYYTEKGKIDKQNIEIARGYYLFSLLDRESNKKKSISYLDSVIRYSYKSKDFFFPFEAYVEKAKLYTELYDYEKTISNYLMAEKFAKEQNNMDNYYKSKYLIGIFKSEILGEIDEAMDLYNEYKFFLKDKDLNDPYYLFYYKRLLFVLADAHKSIKNIDSSTYYNKLGYITSRKSKDEYTKNLFVLNEGATQVMNNSFKIALDSVKKGSPEIIKSKDLGNTLASYYYYGRCYEGLNNNELAIKYYKKVDSIYQKRNHITPEFVSGYHYLISYYKGKGDKLNQLEYLTKFMKIDSTLQKGYKKWNKLLKDKYDFPHLVEDKESLIVELNNDKKVNYWIIIILSIGVALSLFLVQAQIKQKKQYKKRFDLLMQQSVTVTDDEVERKEEEEKQEESADLGIPEDVVVAILKQLAVFENKKQYLKPNITLGDLATAFETNSKYVSIVINAKKQKSFSNYINDLRIDHAVEGLKNNKEMRKYTIKAIAEEVGFNNAEAFSNAFFRRTGIKPSYFVKKIQEG